MPFSPCLSLLLLAGWDHSTGGLGRMPTAPKSKKPPPEFFSEEGFFVFAVLGNASKRPDEGETGKPPRNFRSKGASSSKSFGAPGRT